MENVKTWAHIPFTQNRINRLDYLRCAGVVFLGSILVSILAGLSAYTNNPLFAGLQGLLSMCLVIFILYAYSGRCKDYDMDSRLIAISIIAIIPIVFILYANFLIPGSVGKNTHGEPVEYAPIKNKAQILGMLKKNIAHIIYAVVIFLLFVQIVKMNRFLENINYTLAGVHNDTIRTNSILEDIENYVKFIR